GRLGGRARAPAGGAEPPGRAGLATRLARRPHPRPLRTALVALAEPEHAAHGPGRRDRAWRAAGVLARPEAPRLGTGGTRIRAGVPPLPGRRVPDAERVPSGRARVPAPALRLLVPRRGPPCFLRRLRRARRGDEGGDPIRDRRDGRLVRILPAALPRGWRD